jgi:hypothetical protein
MTRVHKVEKARRDYPDHGIKKGEPYYWWAFRFGGKHMSKEPPRRSQTTQSAFYGTLWDIEDDLSALPADDGLKDALDDIASRLRELGEECQSSLDNMPEGLQQGDTGQLLQERIDGCESAADELENIDCDVESKGDDQTEEEFWQEKLDEAQQVSMP